MSSRSPLAAVAAWLAACSSGDTLEAPDATIVMGRVSDSIAGVQLLGDPEIATSPDDGVFELRVPETEGWVVLRATDAAGAPVGHAVVELGQDEVFAPPFDGESEVEHRALRHLERSAHAIDTVDLREWIGPATAEAVQSLDESGRDQAIRSLAAAAATRRFAQAELAELLGSEGEDPLVVARSEPAARMNVGRFHGEDRALLEQVFTDEVAAVLGRLGYDPHEQLAIVLHGALAPHGLLEEPLAEATALDGAPRRAWSLGASLLASLEAAGTPEVALAEVRLLVDELAADLREVGSEAGAAQAFDRFRAELFRGSGRTATRHLVDRSETLDDLHDVALSESRWLAGALGELAEREEPDARARIARELYGDLRFRIERELVARGIPVEPGLVEVLARLAAAFPTADEES